MVDCFVKRLLGKYCWKRQDCPDDFVHLSYWMRSLYYFHVQSLITLNCNHLSLELHSLITLNCNHLYISDCNSSDKWLHLEKKSLYYFHVQSLNTLNCNHVSHWSRNHLSHWSCNHLSHWRCETDCENKMENGTRLRWSFPLDWSTGHHDDNNVDNDDDNNDDDES